MPPLNGVTHLSAREQGLTDEIKQAIPHFREPPLFTPAEKAVLQLADAMAADHKNAPYDEIFSELKKYYTEEQIVALCWKTRIWLGYGRLVHAHDVPSGGESCAIPLKRKRLGGFGENLDRRATKCAQSKANAYLLLALSLTNKR
jgi:hypothetical protein